jgi:hypothetical protein
VSWPIDNGNGPPEWDCTERPDDEAPICEGCNVPLTELDLEAEQDFYPAPNCLECLAKYEVEDLAEAAS